MSTTETTAAYRAVYEAMPPGYWPLVRRMGTWRDQRPGHHEISEILLIRELLRRNPIR